jgi:hypothetical protein
MLGLSHERLTYFLASQLKFEVLSPRSLYAPGNACVRRDCSCYRADRSSKRLRVSSQSSAAATSLSSQDAESKLTATAATASEIVELVSARRDAAALASIRGALNIPELKADVKKQIEDLYAKCSCNYQRFLSF